MSTNTDIVEAAIASFNRGDWQAALERATPDFVLDWSRATGPIHGVFDLETAPSVFTEYADSWQANSVEIQEVIEVDDQVVAPTIVHVTGRAGIEITSRPTYVFTFRDGALTRMTMYQERADALADVGVSER